MGAAEAENKLAGRNLLAPDQISDLKREARSHEWAINGRSSFDGEKIDVMVHGHAPEPELAQEQLTKINHMLDVGTAPSLNDLEKGHIYRRTIELENEIQNYMPTEEMMEKPNATNIDAHMNWERHNQAKIQEWKTYRRALDPQNDDPNFTNIEVLRRSGPVFNPRQYWDGFKNINFAAVIEQVHVTVDDSLYMEFLKYKALEWADKSIKKHLGMTDAQFDGATNRLFDERAAAPREPEDMPTVADETTRNWLDLELEEVGMTKTRLAQDTGQNTQTINRILAGEEVRSSVIAKVKARMAVYKALKSRRENAITAKVEPETKTTEEVVNEVI